MFLLREMMGSPREIDRFDRPDQLHTVRPVCSDSRRRSRRAPVHPHATGWRSGLRPPSSTPRHGRPPRGGRAFPPLQPPSPDLAWLPPPWMRPWPPLQHASSRAPKLEQGRRACRRGWKGAAGRRTGKGRPRAPLSWWVPLLLPASLPRWLPLLLPATTRPPPPELPPTAPRPLRRSSRRRPRRPPPPELPPTAPPLCARSPAGDQL
jgi:hypothetical protein